MNVGRGVALGWTSIPVLGSALPGDPEAADEVSLEDATVEGSGSLGKRPHESVASMTIAANTDVKTGAVNRQRTER